MKKARRPMFRQELRSKEGKVRLVNRFEYEHRCLEINNNGAEIMSDVFYIDYCKSLPVVCEKHLCRFFMLTLANWIFRCLIRDRTEVFRNADNFTVFVVVRLSVSVCYEDESMWIESVSLDTFFLNIRSI